MFWLICLLGVAFIVASILKVLAPKELENYTSLGLALRLLLLIIGLLVIFVVYFLLTHWNKPIGQW